MATSINTNASASIAQNNLRTSSAASQTSISRLSSGNRITRASDDVAALSIGTILRTDVSTLKTALNNANQGTTLLQVADGALARVGEILQRQKTLSTQALSGTLGDTERGYLNQEFQALVSELNRIVDTTNFNGVKLINGNLAGGGSGSQVTQAAAAASITAALTDPNVSVDTAILTGGAGAFAVSNAGTVTDNSTITKLFGDLKDIAVSVTDGSGGDTVQATITINGVSFSTAVDGIDLDNTNSNVAFTATDGSGVIITLDIADQNTTTPNQAAATTFQNKLKTELQKLSIYQDKKISVTAGDAGSIRAADTNGTVLQGLTGDDILVRGKSGFTDDPATKTLVNDIKYKSIAPALSNFKIDVISTTKATFSIDVGGTTYYAKEATIDTDIGDGAQDFGTDPDGNDLSPATGQLRLYNLNDLQSYVTINTQNLGALNVTDQAYADAFTEVFNKILTGGSSGGASFAVGTDATDVIAVSLSDVGSDKIYVDANGDAKTLTVSSSTDAKTASEVLDLAIQKVTEARANVGSLQSRFGYASATLETSITNLDAARGQFLDADISAESTSFANNQVLTQAAISVLAQANQLTQNLLKLIQ